MAKIDLEKHFISAVEDKKNDNIRYNENFKKRLEKTLSACHILEKKLLFLKKYGFTFGIALNEEKTEYEVIIKNEKIKVSLNSSITNDNKGRCTYYINNSSKSDYKYLVLWEIIEFIGYNYE